MSVGELCTGAAGLHTKGEGDACAYQPLPRQCCFFTLAGRTPLRPTWTAAADGVPLTSHSRGVQPSPEGGAYRWKSLLHLHTPLPACILVGPVAYSMYYDLVPHQTFRPSAPCLAAGLPHTPVALARCLPLPSVSTGSGPCLRDSGAGGQRGTFCLLPPPSQFRRLGRDTRTPRPLPQLPVCQPYKRKVWQALLSLRRNKHVSWRGRGTHLEEETTSETHINNIIKQPVILDGRHSTLPAQQLDHAILQALTGGG